MELAADIDTTFTFHGPLTVAAEPNALGTYSDPALEGPEGMSLDALSAAWDEWEKERVEEAAAEDMDGAIDPELLDAAADVNKKN
ncbi:unnamed protein product [Somion occarium]|uniref:Conjugal transfer protein TraD n=1 Tax=Somion occarium TaxID=3059160 RepID=A0ABP1EAG4_9APHY